MESQEQRRSGLLHSALPLWVALGAFFVFLYTINRWVAVTSLPAVMAAGGWDWAPPVYQPLSYLAVLPLRLLPEAWQPLGLNLLAAALAAATLGLLTRSVILLPHDRTREQRRAEGSERSLLSLPEAWVPPVFAVLVAGLQLTFWEHATAFSGEMLDLFVFAFCVRSVLEFRIDRRESRLTAMAFVYGLGVTNNFALIAFFPAFLVALVWICGREFFRAQFFLRMVGWGTAGLSLYLLLPLLGVISDGTYSFWDLLRSNFAAQKTMVFHTPPLRWRVAMLSLTSILPLMAAGIRWPSSFGETSAAGEWLTKFAFHAVHALFLGACVLMAFDTGFSPRNLGFGLPFLTFYFIGALCAGYYSGYLLLMLHPRSERKWGKQSAAIPLAKQAATALLFAAFAAVPAALVVKNHSPIRAANGPALREFVRAKVARLPASGAVLLADEPVNLRLVEAELRAQGRARDFVFAETRWMPNLAYERRLARRHPQRWPAAVHDETLPPWIDSPSMIGLLGEVARSNAVYYLHPSFGYYFEGFLLVPHGMTYELKPYAPGMVGPPPMSESAIRENAEFWRKMQGSMSELIQHQDPRNFGLTWLGRNYSLGLNHWGAELQRAGHLEAAGRLFQLAVDLNPDNASATINLEFNKNLRAGSYTAVELTKAATDRFGQYRSWDAVLSANGPIDEPVMTFRLGQEFARNSQHRQAAIQFQRAAQLNPKNIDARFALAASLVQANLIDEALQQVGELRKSATPLSVARQIDLAKIEARAHQLRGNLAESGKLLRAAHARFPQDESLLDALAQMHLLSANFKEAMSAIDEQLRLSPDSPRALLNKGAVAIQLKDYATAIPPLNRIIELQPKNTAARMNRAIALLQSGDVDAALADYEMLHKAMPNQFAVQYGLGEIAYRKQNLPAAIEHYAAYLRLAPTNSAEAAKIRLRVEELKSRGAR